MTDSNLSWFANNASDPKKIEKGKYEMKIRGISQYADLPVRICMMVNALKKDPNVFKLVNSTLKTFDKSDFYHNKIVFDTLKDISDYAIRLRANNKSRQINKNANT